jgi:adenosylcobinamide-GDP ribazoletransferase
MTAPETRADAAGAATRTARAVDELRVALTALMFLTRIPGPRSLGDDAARLARSTAWFPLVGVVVGLVGAGVLALASEAWPPLVAAALSTAVTVWLTGALHEDALADACDGFGGGWDRARVLTIMKDSRVGSYGVVGLALVLLVKVGAIAALAEASVGGAVRALIVAHTLGRWSSLPLIHALPDVRDDGAKSRPFAGSVTMPRLIVGSAWALAATTLALAPLGTGAVGTTLACAALVTVLGARYFQRRLGGMTGDCLGAANQLVEVGTYLVLASAWLRP